ncbi:PaaI family thioesterase [Thermococcus gammatolerans]|uniref:Thioesterase, putative n=1 Tax=Thermococcus gammatolerans (strain DSM 15229 / JCM 11827 / EJ3) TaxID=593117 RepID=C5A6H2_THEGJ|nr:PaaI family thioesterase [Thermococcus gammatolerans]ACS33834.1 Thioesterase, putative [Thermococcus gammatolerans EJ3]
MEQRTHKLTSGRLVGKPVKIEPGRAEVELLTTDEMAVDEYGLVHGSFTFGLADYAAMLAVNEPTVVLGKAEVKFLKPVKAGERLIARAEVVEDLGRKKIVRAEVLNDNGERVFEGTFHCYVLEKHVLEKGD